MKKYILSAFVMFASYQVYAVPKGVLGGLRCVLDRQTDIVVADLDLRAMIFSIRTEIPTSGNPMSGHGMICGVANIEQGSVEYTLCEGPQEVGSIKTTGTRDQNTISYFEYKGQILGSDLSGFKCLAQ